MQKTTRVAAFVLTALVVASWACHTATPPAGSGAAGGACQFIPTAVALAVDSVATIVPNPSCSGSIAKRKATLTWSDPQLPLRAGLNIDLACTKQAAYRTGVWKVSRCARGSALLTIYSDSAGTSILQTILIEDAMP